MGVAMRMAISPTLQLVYQLKITAIANELMFRGHFSNVMQLFSPYQLQEVLPVISRSIHSEQIDLIDTHSFLPIFDNESIIRYFKNS